MGGGLSAAKASNSAVKVTLSNRQGPEEDSQIRRQASAGVKILHMPRQQQLALCRCLAFAAADLKVVRSPYPLLALSSAMPSLNKPLPAEVGSQEESNAVGLFGWYPHSFSSKMDAVSKGTVPVRP